jgi:hypothetical protein
VQTWRARMRLASLRINNDGSMIRAISPRRECTSPCSRTPASALLVRRKTGVVIVECMLPFGQTEKDETC